MHLLHHVRVAEVGQRRPRLQLLLDLLQDVDAAPLQLRPGTPVQNQPLTALQPFDDGHFPSCCSDGARSRSSTRGSRCGFVA